MNIDIHRNMDLAKSVVDYFNLLNMYGFSSLIIIATRIKSPSVTQIDNILCRFQSDDLSIDLRSHFPVLCVLQHLKTESIYVKRKLYSEETDSNSIISLKG